MVRNDLADWLETQLLVNGLPAPVREFRFAAQPQVPKPQRRQFRADLAWPQPQWRLLVEAEGGIWARTGARRCPVCGGTEAGAHGRGWGVQRDIEKGNLATLLGWRLLRVSAADIESGQALAWIREALGLEAAVEREA